jgi:acetyltransferase EpsM
MATVQTAPQGVDLRARMTPHDLVLIGAGEHARVVADAALSRPEVWRLTGFTDPLADPIGAALGLPRLGDDAELAAQLATMTPDARPSLVLGFGGPPAARRAAVATIGDGAEWATVVHARAWVSSSAVLEAGVVVLAGAVVNAGARIGAHAIINSGAVVEHDVTIGARTHVAPGAVIGGGTRTGEDVLVGLGATVRDHITVGRGAVVGMGAVVVADVDPGTTVVGVPARVRGMADG